VGILDEIQNVAGLLDYDLEPCNGGIHAKHGGNPGFLE
jgi:hypothetical protein